ncbi:nuclear transport factor 2 family protein [Streptomyces sp. E11-3]|uniref:nuclear transport factor 2 family protein n=1 Tax=Streptomyces sp. E11-3 TaxID=3110112 RepID=UPI00397F1AB8
MDPTNINATLTDLLFTTGLALEEAVERHFAPDYRQRTDGVWTNRAQFTEHIACLKQLITSGSIEVHEELRHGHLYADRHTVTLRKRDGTTARSEVYLFGEYAPDGRFLRIEETTLLLDGTTADRTLGAIR